MIRVLFLGDVVGEPGRKAVIDFLPKFKEEKQIDFAIVNGENSAGGRGITPRLAIELMRAGAAVITTGDHVWDQPELVGWIQTEPRVLRPMNYPQNTPGQGFVVLETKKGPVAVMQAQGRSFIQPPLENPFLLAMEKAQALRDQQVMPIIVDFHAETTSEKIAFGRYLDGHVSAVLGTHTHVQTADEQIFPKGTAFLCDAGMCGPNESILGREPEPIISRFVTGLPAKFPVAKGPVRLCGAIIDIDENTGSALNIERLNHLMPLEDPAAEK